jgi:hypothetical protein
MIIDNYHSNRFHYGSNHDTQLVPIITEIHLDMIDNFVKYIIIKESCIKYDMSTSTWYEKSRGEVAWY